MWTRVRQHYVAALVVVALILVGLVVARMLRFGWVSVVHALGLAVPFVVDNMVGFVNFVVLVLVIIGLQRVRVELQRRAQLVERIEKTVDRLQHDDDAAKAKAGDGER